DAVVAAGFVLAGLAEAVVLHRHPPALLAFTVCGAPLLGVLAVRRIRPLVPLCVIAGFAVLGTTIQSVFWADAGDGGGVWLFALMFASYSLGAHGRGRAVVLGGLVPLLLGLAVDLPTMAGWALANGVLFLTAFVGVLPTAVGRVVRMRRERLTALDEQRDLVLRGHHTQREAAVLAERLRTTERLQPGLLDGLVAIADRAETGADPSEIEQVARRLLGRTREEVVALTAPVEVPDPPVPPAADHLPVLRAAAQRWTVLAAGGIGAGLALESTGALRLSAPAGLAVVAGVAVGLPLSLVWWRPLAALAMAWCAVVAFSRLIAPLDGSLSGTTFALAGAFAVAVLCTRRDAIVGLALCWLGQLVGVGTDDPLGEAVIIFVCWLGGLAVNEASLLVEQSRANNLLLAEQQAVAKQRAVVEERLRLAREVHDQIGHSLTVVALQAGAARRLAGTDPQRARQVMETIVQAAREGSTAMTSRGGTDVAGLLDRTRDAGLTLTADVADLDAPGLLDSETREVACRIVQEGLTNVLRHAPGADATVTVRRECDGVSVNVRNGVPTRAGGAAGGGRGLTGLRERVAAHGGELGWGLCEDGGFELRAVLPVRRLEEAGR
ncbi:MAG TPA: histidine kinase, partial [Miltoncostaeaceae bacterium]|nr:histidine kinase [Miltoncostaeaceae bacterium]